MALGAPSLASLPPVAQGVYVLGLYLILWQACSHFYTHFQLPALPRPRLGDVAQGLIAAWVALGLLTLLACSLGAARWQGPTGTWLPLLLQALLLGLVIALIEERLFRGLLQDLLQQRYHWEVASLLQGLIFVLLHLLRWPLPLTLLLQAPGLLLTALVLSRARQQSGRLGASIGLHAGWVSFCSAALWSQALVWMPDYALWTGMGNPVGGLSGWILLLFLERGIACSHVLTPFANICNNETTD